MNAKFSRIYSNKSAMLGNVLIVAWVVVALFAPLLAPYDPLRQYSRGVTMNGMPIPPNNEFLLGTDSLGRDLLSRLIYGGRISLTVSFLSVMLAVIIGMVIGSVSGYFGGWTDFLLMRLTDVVLAFPPYLLAIASIVVLKPGLVTLIGVISFITWAPTARLIRGQVIAAKNQDFVEAARVLGASDVRILLYYIIPNIIWSIIVFAILEMKAVVLLEASLSYLGIGVQPPAPSWGNMILEGSKYYRTSPWLVLVPGLAVTSLSLGLVLLGEGLRDALDPLQYS